MKIIIQLCEEFQKSHNIMRIFVVYKWKVEMLWDKVGILQEKGFNFRGKTFEHFLASLQLFLIIQINIISNARWHLQI